MPIRSRERLDCSLENCTKKAVSRTYCSTHYNRWRVHGDVQAHIPVKTKGDKLCKIESCTNISKSLEWCTGHYVRYKKLGDPQAWKPFRRAILECKVNGCNKPHCALGYCAGHHRRFVKHGDPLAHKPMGIIVGVRLNDDGYLTEYDYATKKRRLQHRIVMEQLLGRPLRPGENVHHINGIRSDNCPENLELWVSSQPSGQRVDDLVQWAYEIIELYGSTSVSP